MATLANSVTHIQSAREVVSQTLGQSSSVDKTVYRGSPVYFGTDDDGNTNRVIPVTDISAHAMIGVCLTSSTDAAAGTKSEVSVALMPCRILTNNVASGVEPEATADNRVYVDDSGQFTDTDGGSAGHSYGSCLYTRVIGGTTYYLLELTGRDET
jgi:hypothetical protein